MGPGLTVFFGKEAISISVSAFHGPPGWSLVPAINFSSILEAVLPA